MNPQPTAPTTLTADDPVVRHCREVIAQSGAVTLAVLDDPASDLHMRTIARVNPALAGALRTFLDAVMTLDATTGFLNQTSAGSLPA